MAPSSISKEARLAGDVRPKSVVLCISIWTMWRQLMARMFILA